MTDSAEVVAARDIPVVAVIRAREAVPAKWFIPTLMMPRNPQGNSEHAVALVAADRTKVLVKPKHKRVFTTKVTTVYFEHLLRCS